MSVEAPDDPFDLWLGEGYIGDLGRMLVHLHGVLVVRGPTTIPSPPIVAPIRHGYFLGLRTGSGTGGQRDTIV